MGWRSYIKTRPSQHAYLNRSQSPCPSQTLSWKRLCVSLVFVRNGTGKGCSHLLKESSKRAKKNKAKAGKTTYKIVLPPISPTFSSRKPTSYDSSATESSIQETISLISHHEDILHGSRESGPVKKEQDVTLEDAKILVPPTIDEPEEESFDFQDCIEPTLVAEYDGGGNNVKR